MLKVLGVSTETVGTQTRFVEREILAVETFFQSCFWSQSRFRVSTVLCSLPDKNESIIDFLLILLMRLKTNFVCFIV